MKRLLTIMLFLILPKLVAAQATQFLLEDTVGGKYKVKIYVVGDTMAKNQIQESLYKAVDHANLVFKKLKPDDPNSELGAINAKKTAGIYMVSPELAGAINEGYEASEWSKGLCDLTSPSEQRNYKEIKVKIKTNELKIKKDGTLINLNFILRGFLADTIANDLNTAGWKNVLIKIEDVFVTRGNDVNGPWKIPIITPTDKFAKRAFYYKATDVASATLTINRGPIQVIDSRTKQIASSDLKSVTIFMSSAAKSEGLACGVYLMGFEEGKNFILKYPNLRAVLDNAQGQLTFVPEFKPSH